jgi:hypothetical protein
VRPRWVIALMIVMSGIGLALLGDLIPTAHKLDKWAALAESLIGVSLGLFGYPVFGRGAAIKPADDKQPPMSGAAVVLVLAAFALSACSGLRAVSYKTLAIMTDGATVAANALPASCEAAELAAAKKQPTKELKISESGKVHADCEATAKALSATHDGLTAARNFVANAPDDPTQWPKWVLSAIQLYSDLRPLVAKYGIKLPEVK